jgi:hypothetical protein
LSKRHQLNAEWVCVATIYLLRCRPFYVKMTLVPASGSVWRILAYTIAGAVIDVATSGRDGPRPSGSASARATLLIVVEASRRGSMSAQNRRDEPGGG